MSERKLLFLMREGERIQLVATRPNVSLRCASAGILMCRPVRREAWTAKRRGGEGVAERYLQYRERTEAWSSK